MKTPELSNPQTFLLGRGTVTFPGWGGHSHLSSSSGGGQPERWKSHSVMVGKFCDCWFVRSGDKPDWKNENKGAGELAPWLRASASVPGDLSSVPGPHMSWLTATHNSSSRVSDFFLQRPEVHCSCVHAHAPTYTHCITENNICKRKQAFESRGPKSSPPPFPNDYKLKNETGRDGGRTRRGENLTLCRKRAPVISDLQLLCPQQLRQ